MFDDLQSPLPANIQLSISPSLQLPRPHSNLYQFCSYRRESAELSVRLIGLRRLTQPPNRGGWTILNELAIRTTAPPCNAVYKPAIAIELSLAVNAWTAASMFERLNRYREGVWDG